MAWLVGRLGSSRNVARANPTRNTQQITEPPSHLNSHYPRPTPDPPPDRTPNRQQPKQPTNTSHLNTPQTDQQRKQSTKPMTRAHTASPNNPIIATSPNSQPKRRRLGARSNAFTESAQACSSARSSAPRDLMWRARARLLTAFLNRNQPNQIITTPQPTNNVRTLPNSPHLHTHRIQIPHQLQPIATNPRISLAGTAIERAHLSAAARSGTLGERSLND